MVHESLALAGTATLVHSMEYPQEIKNRAILWPSNCTNIYLPQRYKCWHLSLLICTIIQQDRCYNPHSTVNKTESQTFK